MPKQPIRVLIADDHGIVREGLRMLLSEETEIEVIGEAANGAEAISLASTLLPDVVLMDLVMPEVNGIEAMRCLAEQTPSCRVLVLTSFADDKLVRDAIQAGAIGYLLKDLRREDLVAAIANAAVDRPTLHPEAQRHLMRQVTDPEVKSPVDRLTDRELDVLKLIASGMSNKEIAASLGLTEGTIKGYVSAILAKLDVADRTQAALLAVKLDLGQP